jgi:hypothetical protein
MFLYLNPFMFFSICKPRHTFEFFSKTDTFMNQNNLIWCYPQPYQITIRVHLIPPSLANLIHLNYLARLLHSRIKTIFMRRYPHPYKNSYIYWRHTNWTESLHQIQKGIMERSHLVIIYSIYTKNRGGQVDSRGLVVKEKRSKAEKGV